jgi:hypothetical protein
MTQEALKLALEWAEANGEIVFAGGGMDAVNKMNSWATAIKKALAQQEPVAWLSTDSIGERHLCFDKPLDNDPVQPLYTTPQQRKPLTQDGTMEIANQTAGQYWMDEAHIQRFRAVVEAAHGIRE